jgi:hypothetical protein
MYIACLFFSYNQGVIPLRKGHQGQLKRGEPARWVQVYNAGFTGGATCNRAGSG